MHFCLSVRLGAFCPNDVWRMQRPSFVIRTLKKTFFDAFSFQSKKFLIAAKYERVWLFNYGFATARTNSNLFFGCVFVLGTFALGIFLRRGENCISPSWHWASRVRHDREMLYAKRCMHSKPEKLIDWGDWLSVQNEMKAGGARWMIEWRDQTKERGGIKCTE